MPYIVIKFNDQEIERRKLTGAMVIGRARDCDLAVRDILLSRRHCQLSPGPNGWTLTDLQSKNGTSVNGEKLTASRRLRDNDVVRMARSKIIFYTNVPKEELPERRVPPPRPADPGDSLSGTLSGFTLLLPGESEMPENMPSPQPRPKDPAAYQDEELQTLLSAIAASSWDSIYAQARKPARPLPNATEAEGKSRRRVRPRSPTDFSLQVHSPAPVAAPAADVPVAKTTAKGRLISLLRRSLPSDGDGRIKRRMQLVAALLLTAAALKLNMGWKVSSPGSFGKTQVAKASIAAPLAAPASAQEPAAVDPPQPGDHRHDGF